MTDRATPQFRPPTLPKMGRVGVVDRVNILAAQALSRYSAKSIITGLEQTLPNLRLPSETLQRGSTAGVDVNDPRFLPHTGEDYVEGQLGALNYVEVTPPATVFDGTAIGFDIRVDGLARSDGGFLLGDRRAHLGVSANTSGSVTLRWQEAGGGAFLSLVTGTVLTLGVRSQVRIVTTFGGNTLTYSRASGPDLVSDVGWTLVSTQTGGPASMDRLDGLAVLTNRYDGGVQSAADDGRIFGARWSVSTASDTVVTVFDPSDTSNFTVNRSATGLKTALVTRPLAMSDGTDDYSQLPASATPTFTATTGAHTLLVLYRATVLPSGFRTLWSSTSASNNGAYLVISPGNQVRSLVGGATTSVSVTSATTITADRLKVAAFVQRPGAVSVYDDEGGLSSEVSTAAVGTITHTTPRVMSQAFGVNTPADQEFFDFFDFPGKALTASELDALSARMIAGTI